MKLFHIFVLKRIEIMDEIYNPDWRFAKMTQTEIENHVKVRSFVLLSQQHMIPESSGKKIKFRVTEKDIEHLVADALHRAKGKLYISDISTLPQYFNSAKFIETTKDTKTGNKKVWFHYYNITIGERLLYLNIKEDKLRKTIRLHSITSIIKTTAAVKQQSL